MTGMVMRPIDFLAGTIADRANAAWTSGADPRPQEAEGGTIWPDWVTSSYANKLVADYEKERGNPSGGGEGWSPMAPHRIHDGYLQIMGGGNEASPDTWQNLAKVVDTSAADKLRKLFQDLGAQGVAVQERGGATYKNAQAIDDYVKANGGYEAFGIDPEKEWSKHAFGGQISWEDFNRAGEISWEQENTSFFDQVMGVVTPLAMTVGVGMGLNALAGAAGLANMGVSATSAGAAGSAGAGVGSAGATFSGVEAAGTLSGAESLGTQVTGLTTNPDQFLTAYAPSGTMTDVSPGLLDGAASAGGSLPDASAITGYGGGMDASALGGMSVSPAASGDGLISGVMKWGKENPLLASSVMQLGGGVIAGIGNSMLMDKKIDADKEMQQQRVEDAKALEEWKRRFTQSGSYFDANIKVRPRPDAVLRRPDGSPVYGSPGIITGAMNG